MGKDSRVVKGSVCVVGRDWGKKAQNDEEEIKLSRNIKIFLKNFKQILKSLKENPA